MLRCIAISTTLFGGACREAPPARAHKEAGWIQQECRSLEPRTLESKWESGGGDHSLLHEGKVVARANVAVRYVFRDGQRRIQSVCVTIQPRDHELSYRPSFHVRDDARSRELAIRVDSYGPARDERGRDFPGYTWTLDVPLQPLGRLDP